MRELTKRSHRPKLRAIRAFYAECLVYVKCKEDFEQISLDVRRVQSSSGFSRAGASVRQLIRNRSKPQESIAEAQTLIIGPDARSAAMKQIRIKRV